MKKPAPRRDRYFLRDLHQEIDLYDRKLAYLERFGGSPADRESAEKVLVTKRNSLEKVALELAASGVEYDEKDLPRSFRAMNLEHSSTPKNLTLIKRP
jgi:hypothetical protein